MGRDGSAFDESSIFSLVIVDGSIGFVAISTSTNDDAGVFIVTVVASIDEQVQTEFTFMVEISRYVPYVQSPIPDMTFLIE